MADGGAGLTGGAAVEAGRRVVTLDEATGGLPPTHPLPSIIKELRKLVAIPSVNPEHACSNPEHVGEVSPPSPLPSVPLLPFCCDPLHPHPSLFVSA